MPVWFTLADDLEEVCRIYPQGSGTRPAAIKPLL